MLQVGPGAVKVPDKRNEALWCHMLLGGAAWRRICAARDRGEEAAAAKLEVEGEQPALNFVMTMSGVACEQVRGTHIGRCPNDTPVVQVLEYCVSWLGVTGWTPQYGPWLYALLVRLEKPLTPDTASLLRDLALTAARERRRIAASLGPQDSSEAPDENIAALNLFICLVAKYFGQGDLEDSED